MGPADTDTRAEPAQNLKFYLHSQHQLEVSAVCAPRSCCVSAANRELFKYTFVIANEMK